MFLDDAIRNSFLELFRLFQVLVGLSNEADDFPIGMAIRMALEAPASGPSSGKNVQQEYV